MLPSEYLPHQLTCTAVGYPQLGPQQALTSPRPKIVGEGSSVVSDNQLCKIHVIPGKVPLDAAPVPARILLGQAGHSDDKLVSCVPQGHTVSAVGGEGDDVAIVPEIASAPVFGVVLLVGIIVADGRSCVQHKTFLDLFVHDHSICENTHRQTLLFF